MTRETRDKLTSATQKDVTSGNACWGTPPAVFEKLNHDFGPFDIDLTADASNHLCPRWLGPGSPDGEDALTAPWPFAGSGFSNPPYGPFIPKIFARATRAVEELGFCTTLLLPMRANRAFHAYVLKQAADLFFCDARIAFWEDGHPRWNAKILAETGRHVSDTALFDSIIVNFSPRRTTTQLHVGAWHVPPHCPGQKGYRP